MSSLWLVIFVFIRLIFYDSCVQTVIIRVLGPYSRHACVQRLRAHLLWLKLYARLLGCCMLSSEALKGLISEGGSVPAHCSCTARGRRAAARDSGDSEGAIEVWKSTTSLSSCGQSPQRYARGRLPNSFALGFTTRPDSFRSDSDPNGRR